jgi:thioredoxin 1
MSSTINHVNSFDPIKEADVAVVDFNAEWCGPCKMLEPKFKVFAVEYPKAKFFSIDVDQAADVAEREGIAAMPTINVYKKGIKVDQVVGASADKIKAMLEKHCK